MRRLYNPDIDGTLKKPNNVEHKMLLDVGISYLIPKE